MIFCSRAPVRFDFGGGWTDVSPYAETEGGYVVSTALAMYAYATLRWRDDSRIVITADDYGTVVESDDLAALLYDGRCDLAKAAIRHFAPPRGLELSYHCDAPPGAGLGGSGAVGVALAACLARALGRAATPGELTDSACAIELDELGLPGGKQDQTAAAYGGVNLLSFDTGSPGVVPLRLSAAIIGEIERRAILCYTGESRLSGDLITKGRTALRDQNPEIVGAFRRMRAIALEMKDALLNGNLSALAALLADNWVQQQKLDPSISNARLDQLWAIARENGAVSSKAGGAGGGGCVLYICTPGTESRVARALITADAQILPFHSTKDRATTWLLDDATGRVQI